MSRILFVSVLLSCFALGCNSEKAGGEPAGAMSGAPAAAPAGTTPKPIAVGEVAPCDAVVAKLASYDPKSGEPEKKLWTKMCAELPPAARTCIVASKTEAERDACIKDEKLK